MESTGVRAPIIAIRSPDPQANETSSKIPSKQEQKVDSLINLLFTMPLPTHTIRVVCRFPIRLSPSLLQIPTQRPATLPLVLRRKLHGGQQQQHRQSFFNRLGEALRNTKTEWYAIPAGVGIGVVGFTQIRKNHSRSDEVASGGARPMPEKQIRPMGSWYFPPTSAAPCHTGTEYGTGRSKFSPHSHSKPSRTTGAASMRSRFPAFSVHQASSCMHGFSASISMK